MLFNAIDYWLFFVAIAGAHFLLPQRLRWILLLLGSYYFYMSWQPFYALLLASSTLWDYTLGRLIDASSLRSRRRAWLVLSVAGNLGLLIVFKYWALLRDAAARVAEAAGSHWNVPELHVLLPVGISFYTFQSLSYTIDIYRGKMHAERHLGIFATFISFFPQLVAGPIERASHLLPQFHRETAFDAERVWSGLQLALWGLFKKVVIADRLSLYVDAVYSNVGNHSSASYLLATYAFAFQIYCDFSGYSDIAIGCARVLGYDFTENFNRPYFATSLRDFWRRWHISLSTWLRDYLFVSLGGSRHGRGRTYVSLMLTMLLGGLWHGASYTFLAWGLLHGAILVAARVMEGPAARVHGFLRLPGWLSSNLERLVVFHLVCVGWVFFRANTLADAWEILSSICRDPLGTPFLDSTALGYGFLGIAVLLLVEVYQHVHPETRVRDLIQRQILAVRWAVCLAGIFAIILGGVDSGTQFIYFQF